MNITSKEYFERHKESLDKVMKSVMFNLDSILKKEGFDAIFLHTALHDKKGALYTIVEFKVSSILSSIMPGLFKDDTKNGQENTMQEEDILAYVLERLKKDNSLVTDYVELLVLFDNNHNFQDFYDIISLFVFQHGLEMVRNETVLQNHIDEIYNLAVIECNYIGYLEDIGIRVSVEKEKKLLMLIINLLFGNNWSSSSTMIGYYARKQEHIVQTFSELICKNIDEGRIYFKKNASDITIFMNIHRLEYYDSRGNSEDKGVNILVSGLYMLQHANSINRGDHELAYIKLVVKYLYKILLEKIAVLNEEYGISNSDATLLALQKYIETVKNTIKSINIDNLPQELDKELGAHIIMTNFILESLPSDVTNKNMLIDLHIYHGQRISFLNKYKDHSLYENILDLLAGTEFIRHNWYLQIFLQDFSPDNLVGYDIFMAKVHAKKANNLKNRKQHIARKENYKIGIVCGDRMSWSALQLYLKDSKNIEFLSKYGLDETNFVPICITFNGQKKVYIDNELKSGVYKLIIAFEIDHETHFQKNTMKKFPNQISYGNKTNQHFSKQYFEELLVQGIEKRKNQ